ncbi:hypothetical protein BDFB_000953 [Asbolus verrucosus]|uniref:Uncharacterized protein n=1 Tax=Asbolus verrucosus TaxID=1661398 RepID=A0A482VHY0_ASBVE|nr:hypothetical protein BDFB_000953 [Asbolus verrucosus]
MLLENNSNYSHHLQRSIDTLRSLGDRLGERNVDLRLNQGLNMDRNGLELNLSLNPDRLLQERGLERLINERSLQEQRMNLDHLNHLERSLNPGQERPLMDRNLNNLDRGYPHDRLAERLRMEGGPVGGQPTGHDINDLKYREYKAHLENLRSESSRSIEGRTDDDRGTTPSTPPTPISVGENFQEEKVHAHT